MSAVELSLTDIVDKVYVDDWGQCRQGRFGALRAHVEQGLVTEESIAGELADVVAGTRPGRERDDERILFWHRGLATTDIALGQAILDRADRAGRGARSCPTDDPPRAPRRPRPRRATGASPEDGEPVAIAPALLAAVDDRRARMLAHLEGGASAYGVTTGVGYLSRTRIGPEEQLAFQRSLLAARRGRRPAAARRRHARRAAHPARRLPARRGRRLRPRCARSSPRGSTTAGRPSSPRAASRRRAR